MKTEKIQLVISRNFSPQPCPEKSLEAIAAFTSSLPKEMSWTHQALSSAILFNSEYSHLLRNPITNISLNSETRSLSIEFQSHIPEMQFVGLSLRPSGKFNPFKQKTAISLKDLENFRLETHGYTIPDQNCQYPKWELIQQAVALDNRPIKQGEELTFHNKHIWPDRAYNCALSSAIFIRGKRFNLERAVLEDLPLNETEKRILYYCNELEKRRDTTRDRQARIYTATKGKCLKPQGIEDFSQEFAVYGFIAALKTLFPYLTPSGRKNISLKRICDKDKEVTITSDQAYQTGITDLDCVISPKFAEERGIGLLRLREALINQLYRKKMQASFTEHFYPENIDLLMQRADQYLSELEHTMAAYGISLP